MIEFNKQTVFIHPNSDRGNEEILKIFMKGKNNPNFRYYKNIPHKDYLSILKYSTVMIGNSSSMFLEAPMYRIPIVNIGKRQNGMKYEEPVGDGNTGKKIADILSEVKL